eukprot:188541_1
MFSRLQTPSAWTSVTGLSTGRNSTDQTSSSSLQTSSSRRSPSGHSSDESTSFPASTPRLRSDVLTEGVSNVFEDANFNENVYPEAFSKVYLSVFRRGSNGAIGVCYYDSSTENLYCGSFGRLDVVNSIKMKTMPEVIVTASRQHEDLHESLKQNQLNPQGAFNVVTSKRSEFNMEAARARLRVLNIEDLPMGGKGTNEQTMLLMSVLDFEKEQMISATGALLSYLIKHRILNQLEDDSAPISVRSIKMITTDACVVVDQNTMRSLAVFMVDSHPCAAGSSSSKEGVSLYGLLNCTKTRPGALLLREWMQYPTRCQKKLKNRLDHIDALIHDDSLLSQLSGLLTTVKDVGRIVNRLKMYVAILSDWKALFETIQSFVSIHSIAEQSRCNLPIFEQVNLCFHKNIIELSRLISSVIDFPNSTRTKIRVKPGVSQELDSLKQHYATLDDFLTKVADDDMRNGVMPDCVRTMTITYLPQLGYLIMIPNDRGIPEGDVEDLQYQFSNEECRFYKNGRTKELDETCGDIDGIITDIEASIIRQLAETVLGCSKHLIDMGKRIAVLDVFVALATCAVENNFVRPEITTDNVLVIEDGRHPLQEMFVEGQFIPNSTSIGVDGKSLIHVMTGPNSSGKSVYIKQCGIISFLAHVGSFVPAKSATVGLTDMIFSRIQSQDDVLSSLSTFSADACQMSYMLSHATERSLLLIDEFGKGTLTEDGVGLLSSIVRYLNTLGDRTPGSLVSSRLSDPSHAPLGPPPPAGGGSPKTIIATHFHEIFRYSLVAESERVSFCQMSILSQVKDSGRDDIMFLYKVTPGVSTLSHGIRCAESAGFPENVLKRAHEVGAAISKNETIQPIETETSRMIATRYKTILTEFSKCDPDDDTSVDKLIACIKS